MHLLELFMTLQASTQIFLKSTPRPAPTGATETRNLDEKQTVYKQLSSQAVLSELSFATF